MPGHSGHGPSLKPPTWKGDQPCSLPPAPQAPPHCTPSPVPCGLTASRLFALGPQRTRPGGRRPCLPAAASPWRGTGGLVPGALLPPNCNAGSSLPLPASVSLSCPEGVAPDSACLGPSTVPSVHPHGPTVIVLDATSTARAVSLQPGDLAWASVSLCSLLGPRRALTLSLCLQPVPVPPTPSASPHPGPCCLSSPHSISSRAQNILP